MKQLLNGWYQYYATFVVSLSMLSCGMHVSWTSPAIPRLLDGSHTFTITSNEGSWLTMVCQIGSICGAFIAGPFVNCLGQRRAIQYTALPYFTAWIAIAFGQHIAVLLTVRFIVGLTDAVVFTAVPMYVGEIADANIRGILGSFVGVSVVAGLLAGNALGLYLSIETAALISLSVPAMLFILCQFIPESPYFLLIKHREEAALKSLQQLKIPEMIHSEFERLKQAIDKEMANRGQFLDIVKVPVYRKATIILTTMRCVQQCVGLSVITAYTDTIFSHMEGAVSSDVWVILFYVIKLIMTILSLFTVDKIGRKPLLCISVFGAGLSLAAVGTYSFLEDAHILNRSDYQMIPIAALFAYIIAYSIGLGPVPLLMLGELIPVSVKSYALCINKVCFSLLGILTMKFFQITMDRFGFGVPFITFAFCAFLGLLFVVFYMPETKGLTLEEIQENFQKSNMIT